jgi:hypothetical protein
MAVGGDLRWLAFALSGKTWSSAKAWPSGKT